VIVDNNRPPGTSAPPELLTGSRRGVPRSRDAAEEFLRAWAREKSALMSDAGSVGRRQALRQRLRRRRLVVVAGLMALALASLGSGVFYLVTENIGDNVKRVPDVFGDLDQSARPAAGGSLNFLLVGTDSRSGQPTSDDDVPVDVGHGSRRSDVLMLARLSGDRSTAAVTSIPRDSWVDIPGVGRDKVDEAYVRGGPALLVRTVEDLTGIRINHFGVIDFAGIRPMVDAVGGIDVGIDYRVDADGIRFHPGVNHLDGLAASAYVRPRTGPAGGDLDRAERQQTALRALVARVAEQNTLSNPADTYRLLQAASESVSVDDTLDNDDLRSVASALHDLKPTNITFVRAPVAEFGREGGSSVVHLDPARSAELWAALENDRVADYSAAHPAEALGPVTR
jgi:LCP family protein required for cell wall assembly